MKRRLNLQQIMAAALTLAGLFFLTSSFTFGPVDSARLTGGIPGNNKQRVKVVVDVNGKVTRIDTTFNLPDNRFISARIDTMLQKLDIKGLAHTRSYRMICRDHGFHERHHMAGDFKPGNEHIDILIQSADSGRVNDKGEMAFAKGFMDDAICLDHLIPPPPPLPGDMPQFFQHQFCGDPFAFDTKDPSIVSYEKKDIGNGLEKITIIRKKSDEPLSGKQVQMKRKILKKQMK